jgi:hypothetical protein
MATSNQADGMGVQGPVDDSIKRAEPEDAEEIVSAFNDEYIKYYGKYVDAEKLANFIDKMIEDIEQGEGIVDEERPDEIVRTVEHDDDFIGVSSVKLNDNLAEIGSAIIDPDYRSVGSSNSEEDSVYERLHGNMLSTAEEVIREEKDPANIIYTQLLADVSAASQKVAYDTGFAVTAVYNKKFPIAYEGKGRVTAVDMIWADSVIPNEQEEVYLPGELERENEENIVDFVLGNLNEKRSDEFEELEREVVRKGTDHTDERYRVKSKAVDKPEESPMNFAEVKVVQDDEGDYTWDDVLSEIGEAQGTVENSEDDYWMGVSLDANSSFAPSAARELEGFGFGYAGFNPGKLDSPVGKRDAIEMQFVPSEETYVKQFINEAVDFMDKLGIPYSRENVTEEQKTGYDSSQALEV